MTIWEKQPSHGCCRALPLVPPLEVPLTPFNVSLNVPPHGCHFIPPSPRTCLLLSLCISLPPGGRGQGQATSPIPKVPSTVTCRAHKQSSISHYRQPHAYHSWCTCQGWGRVVLPFPLWILLTILWSVHLSTLSQHIRCGSYWSKDTTSQLGRISSRILLCGIMTMVFITMYSILKMAQKADFKSSH
jgi:hypothetical protein